MATSDVKRLALRVRRLTYALIIIGIISVITTLCFLDYVRNDQHDDLPEGTVAVGYHVPPELEGFTPECTAWENVTRTLEPLMKQHLVDDATKGCPDANSYSCWSDGQRMECKSGVNQSCFQEKLAAIEVLYPAYNETVCTKEILVRSTT